MNDAQKQTLLRAARDTVEAVIKQRPMPKPQSDDAELNACCGCFVTLKNRGRLRGCIGQFTSEIPLIQLVSRMAKASATSDPRFLADRIRAKELPDLEIEISVLSPLRRSSNPPALRLGIDGIYIKKGYASGCFLPQVATETGWTVEEFLSYCCAHKAGLPGDAWKDPETEVYTFTAEVFGALSREI